MKKGIKLLVTCVGALLLVVLFRACAFTTCYIPSTGMENTLLPGDRIVVNKWSYGLRLPLMSLWGYHRWGERSVQREEIVVFNNPADRKERTISCRSIFTGRCVGLPGDTLWVDSLFNLSTGMPYNPDRTSLYAYPPQREGELLQLLRQLAIPTGEVLGKDSAHHLRSFSHYEYYLLEQAIGTPCWIQEHDTGRHAEQQRSILTVPRKGATIEVQPWNRTLLCNTLVLHESRHAEIKEDTLYIDGKPAQHCTFTQDYYWVSANNFINLADSRLFGFVPHSHLIGRAVRIWFSKEPGTGITEGYRWERLGKGVE